jgi:adenylate cyclase
MMRVEFSRHIMGIEIERKFLIANDGWRAGSTGSARIVQGYFARTPLLRARIRIYGEKGFITLKSQSGTLVRHEFEYEIPKADAVEMIRQFSIEPVISKQRYDVPFAGVVWAVDVFDGANKGLIIAEAELATPDQPLDLPPWVGREVTTDDRYGNSNLARNPYVTWTDESARSTEAD